MGFLLHRFWEEMAARPNGPLALRFYMQPLMALALATMDGVRDARAGRPPYLWSLFKATPAERRQRFRHGWRSISRVFFLALLLDTGYQVFVLRGMRPLAGVVVAFFLAIVPYLLFRGPVDRIVRRFPSGGPGRPTRRRA